MIYFHQYVYVLIQYYATPITKYFSIFFAIEIFKNILYVQKVIRSDVIRSVFLYVQTLYVRYLYTFRFIRSDVIRSDVIRSVFIRSDVIRSDVIRSVIIRPVGESSSLIAGYFEYSVLSWMHPVSSVGLAPLREEGGLDTRRAQV
jgi:hypothetical protein